ncbi:MAG: hypothetical protein ACTJHY_07785 [Alcaligenes pakistanensis]
MTRKEPTLDTTSQDIRAGQVEILRRLEKVAPDTLNIAKLADIPDMPKHIKTLEGYGLIEFNDCSGLGVKLQGFAAITAKGRSHIQADGGLGEDLDVVTIKLHDESLQLIEAWIRLSNLKPTEREKWIRLLKELPRESTKHLVLELVKLGLGRPESLSAIQTLLSGGLA